jgi:hypothetical protein
MFIHRRVYNQVGLFDTNFSIAADYEFLCRLTRVANFSSFYLNQSILRMQLGGISTRGLKNTILLNKEVMQALRKNNFETNLLMILSKYPSKFFQYFKK